MTVTLLSADEYLATGETRSRWTQLIQGEVIVNGPRLRHQRLVSHIHVSLVNWTSQTVGRGESPPRHVAGRPAHAFGADGECESGGSEPTEIPVSQLVSISSANRRRNLYIARPIA
jgi:hypothetical protein